MANKKFYTIEKEINGTKYVAQFNGIAAATEAIDATYIEGTSTTSTAKLTKYILDKVIVEPKGLTADDFDTMDELGDVVAFGRDVMQGNFRDQAEQGKAK